MIERLAVIPLLLCLFAPASVSAQGEPFDTTRLKYLFSPLELLASINRRSDVKMEEFAEAFAEACHALGELSIDPEFKRLIEFYEQHQYDTDLSTRVSETFQDFGLFVEYLRAERKVLIEHLSEEAANEVLARMLAARLQTKNFRIDGDAIAARLDEAKDEICMAVQAVEGKIELAELRNFAGRSFLAVAGGVAMAVDGPMGLTVVGVASVTLGALFVFLAGYGGS
jgi:hypothetical protein